MQTFALAEDPTAATSVPLTAAEHYILNVHAGIFHLLAFLQRLSQAEGSDLQEYLGTFPFLQGYFKQVNDLMPAGLDWGEGCLWWRNQCLQQEEDSSLALPLKALRQRLRVGFASRMALMIIGLVEEDSRFGTLFARLQQPLGYRRPMLETVGQIMSEWENLQPWYVVKPLLDHHLVKVENKPCARSEWILSANPVLWDAIRGNELTEHPLHSSGSVEIAAQAKLHYRDQLPHFSDLIIDSGLGERVRAIPDLVRNNQVRVLIVRSQPGSHYLDLLGSIARDLDYDLCVIQTSVEKSKSIPLELTSYCCLVNAIPVFLVDVGPGETLPAPNLGDVDLPCFIVLGKEGGIEDLDSTQLVSLDMPSLHMEERGLLWQRHLHGLHIDDVDAVALRFRLPGDYIRQVANIARNAIKLEHRTNISVDDIKAASRHLNRQKMDSLADHLDAKGQWSQLVTTDATTEKLHELQKRCHQREQLLDHLGRAFKNSSNCGVRALFTGRSGTGKTLSAKILAAELGMDIYRVDLAAIVNKYIGETEKNLNKVLSYAEALDVILLLDEGDSLLGSRTDVKSANDRYANLETNYLLQRLEHYQGVILITTNLSDNIDKAFQRRMDIVVPFDQPQAQQRAAIFNLHLPVQHNISANYLDQIATYCALMGGQIRNVCMHAALEALNEKRPLGDDHLEFALRSEYRKNGGTFPLDSTRVMTEKDGGMNMFVGALMGKGG